MDVDDRRLAPLVGAAACLAVVAALLYPYLVARGVGLYYGTGLVNPLVAAVLALVGVIVFAAGREGRSDPGLAAGAGLVFGLFIFIVVAAWAGTVRLGVVELSRYHRWVATALAATVPLAAAWYARSLGLV